MDTELKAQLDRIERKLSALMAERKEKKETWAKVTAVMEATGWNSVQLRRMRENGLIEYKRTETGIWYLLESIPASLIKPKSYEQTIS